MIGRVGGRCEASNIVSIQDNALLLSFLTFVHIDASLSQAPDALEMSVTPNPKVMPISVMRSAYAQFLFSTQLPVACN